MEDLKPKYPWFYKTSRLGSMIPLNWKGWLWLSLIMGMASGTIIRIKSLEALGHSPATQVWWIAFGVIILAGILTAWRKTKKV